MKLNVMNTKPELTDEEVRSYMNFDGLMKEFKSTPKRPAISTPIKIVSILSGIAIISVVSYFIGQNSQEPPTESVGSNSEISPPDLDTKIRQLHKDSVAGLSEKKNRSSKKETVEKTADLARSKRIILSDAEGAKSSNKKSDSTKTTQATGYLQAEPVSGFPHLYEYFSSELKYPEEAVKDSIQGIVTVSFIINEQGKPGKIAIVNSLGPIFDKEVLRLIENMPAWKPARMNGAAVPSKISMPLTFRLERIKK